MNGKTNPGKKDDKPSVDKTYIEGENTGNTSASAPLRPGARVDATSLKAVNPYTQTSTGKPTRPFNQDDMLPSGNEPIPLGSGTIVGMIGMGGMARVYKIWNEKLEVFRAVKILLPNHQADLVNRFETEAKITAKLHHPNIVEVYNVGDWNTLPFLEMEYIDGVSLESMIHKFGKLPDSVCSSIAILIARALSYAHSQEFLIYGKNYHGVIHRDLKPANIMLSSQGEVKLMDFGIARPTEASLHTVEGNIVGTMQYLSPEQMDGVDIDCRTDIYSFGAILYEILTGTKTFPQDTITNLMKKKIMNEYRRFSEFDFNVSQQLARISQKCLQLSKEDRYSSADMLLRDLETAHRTITTDPPAKLMRSYMKDPDSIKESASKKIPAFLSFKVLIPAAAVLALAAIVSLILMTGPKKEENQIALTPPTSTQQTSTPQTSAVQATPTGQGTGTEDGLRPLAGGTTPIPTPQVDSAQQTTSNRQSAQSTRPQLPSRQSSVGKLPSVNSPVQTRPKMKEPVQTVRTPELSPSDRLSRKYNTKDLFAIGKMALRAGAYDDVITALEMAEVSGAEGNQKTMYLLEAYVATNRTKDALFIVNSQSIADAQYDYLCGRVYQLLGKNKSAIENYENALTKPSSVRSRAEIRNDALYQTAVVYTEMYRANPSSDVRFQALNAWNTVKRLYGSTPDNPRFKKANTEMAAIQ